ncbi:MAG TPA: NUDIX domain-containing protein [Blastocatellia bacterium]|nr:NUDIX domain-containing protein [Blastocatellia bacterium]
MAFRIPEFGTAASGAEYLLRPGGYAVIFNGAGAVAVVSTPRGLFLPGGGQEFAESPEEAAIREAREECGLHISLGGHIGVADELVFAEGEGAHYRKRCVFFFAEIVEELGVGEPDHELAWLASDAAVRELRHESQRWAVSKACRLITVAGVSIGTK